MKKNLFILSIFFLLILNSLTILASDYDSMHDSVIYDSKTYDTDQDVVWISVIGDRVVDKYRDTYKGAFYYPGSINDVALYVSSSSLTDGSKIYEICAAFKDGSSFKSNRCYHAVTLEQYYLNGDLDFSLDYSFYTGGNSNIYFDSYSLLKSNCYVFSSYAEAKSYLESGDSSSSIFGPNNVLGELELNAYSFSNDNSTIRGTLKFKNVDFSLVAPPSLVFGELKAALVGVINGKIVSTGLEHTAKDSHTVHRDNVDEELVLDIPISKYMNELDDSLSYDEVRIYFYGSLHCTTSSVEDAIYYSVKYDAYNQTYVITDQDGNPIKSKSDYQYDHPYDSPNDGSNVSSSIDTEVGNGNILSSFLNLFGLLNNSTLTFFGKVFSFLPGLIWIMISASLACLLIIRLVKFILS